MSEYTSPDLIPLQRGGIIISTISLAYAEDHPGQYKVRRSKSGVALAAIIRLSPARLTPWTPLKNDGTAFQQQLDSGHVWALRGTPGSQRAESPI